VENFFGTIVALFGFFGISFAVEKSPIKINPLSMIKKFLIGDLDEKVDNVNKKVENIGIKVDENEKDRIRYTILEYKKSLDNGIRMSDNEMEHVSKLFDKYRNELNGNSFVCQVYKEIVKMYSEQQKKNLTKK
jgi:hypothetical protein